jgi:hypothetical protein
MEARRYVDPTRREIDNLYNMIAHMDDYINPTMNGEISWRRIRYAHQIHRKDLNNGSIGCMKCQPEGAHTLLVHYIGSK